MTDNTKKGLIIAGIGVSVIIVILVIKNAIKSAQTKILPYRTQIPRSSATSNSIINTLTNEIKSALKGTSSITLPAGLKLGADKKSIVTVADNTPIITFDPNTGAYQEKDGTWYLMDGTPLLAYDIKNGTYQESDGSWYSFDGTALSYYEPVSGNYAEADDPTTLYNNAGNVINDNFNNPNV